MNKSENEILFRVLRYILLEGTDREVNAAFTLTRVRQRLASYWANKGKEVDFNFSHDNMTAIAVFLRLRNLDFDEFPVFGHHSLRPDNFFFYLRCKHPMTGSLFWFIPMIAMWISAVRVERTRPNGQKYIDTDGVQLAFMKLKAVKAPITKFVMDYLVKKFRGGYEITLRQYHWNRPGMLELIGRYDWTKENS